MRDVTGCDVCAGLLVLLVGVLFGLEERGEQFWVVIFESFKGEMTSGLSWVWLR